MTIYSKQKLKSLVLYQGIKESVPASAFMDRPVWFTRSLVLRSPWGWLVWTQTQTLYEKTQQELQSWLILSSIGRIPRVVMSNSDNIDASSSKKCHHLLTLVSFQNILSSVERTKRKCTECLHALCNIMKVNWTSNLSFWNKNKHHKCWFYSHL